MLRKLGRFFCILQIGLRILLMIITFGTPEFETQLIIGLLFIILLAVIDNKDKQYVR